MTDQPSGASHHATLLQAYQTIKALRAEIQELKQAQHAPIAIIGMSCRFPAASTPEAFWELLRAGRDAVRDFPPERWDRDTYYDPNPDTPGKTYVWKGSFLEHDALANFDAAFFNISPREAESLDPQQRLVLEVAWEALERAGIPPDSLRESLTGVFIGSGYSFNEYGIHHTERLLTDAYMNTGTDACQIAGRLAYTLGLQGPTLVAATACSASLVALHLACQSLRKGECNLALVGGADLRLAIENLVLGCRMNTYAADGYSRTFDAGARGYGIGEGCGMLVLKRLNVALADGDHILAVVRGSAINHDGPSAGLTVPNGKAQERVLQAALRDAQLDARQMGYVEAHGTGTSLGDPIEGRALGRVFGTPEAPLLIGSVKTNIGHLETAAGVAGVMKVILALQHDEIPPSLNFQSPNPGIPWDEVHLNVVTERTPWPAGRKFAGVSGFGVSGTNAHIILEPAPEFTSPNGVAPTGSAAQKSTERSHHLLCLSGKTAAALTAQVAQYANFLATHPDMAFADICHTAATGRVHFNHRQVIIAGSTGEAQAHLAEALTSDVAQIRGNTRGKPPRIAFLFTGHGGQYVGMGRQLDAASATFRAAIDACEKALVPLLDRPLRDILYPADDDPHALMQTMTYSQPAIFAIGYALARLWQSWGIQPSAVMGHSIGEYIAACIAGVFSLEDALKLVAARGRLMDTVSVAGGMATVFAAAETVAGALAAEPQVAIAARNGPARTVIAGERTALERVLTSLEAQGIEVRRLHVAQAGHSPLLDPVLDAFEQVAQTVRYTRPQIPLISGLFGRRVQGDIVMSANYWRRHLREPVQFTATMRELQTMGIQGYLEAGSHPMLMGLGPMCLTEQEPEPFWLPSLKQGNADWQQMLTSLGHLYVQGATIDWTAVDQDYPRQKVLLPTYPFQRQHYWLPAMTTTRQSRLRPLVDTLIRSPLLTATVAETQVSTTNLPWLKDHRVFEAVVMPGAGHLALVLSVANLLAHPHPWQLSDVVLPQPLVIPPDGETQVQLVLTPAQAEQNVSEFQLISLAAADAGEADAIHATGTLAPAASTSTPAETLDEIRARCPEPVDPAHFYNADEAVTLGPAFRWLAEVWAGEGETVARLVQPEALESTEGYVLHPGLLDACFQLTMNALDAAPTEQTLLPFALKSFSLMAPAHPANGWWAAVRQTGPTTWDITLWHADGQLLAVIAGFELRAVRKTDAFAQEEYNSWLYAMAWHPQPQPALVAPSAPGTWLILSSQAELGQTLAAQMQQHGQNAVLVSLVAPSLPTNGHRMLDPTDPQALNALLAQAMAPDHPPLQGVVYLWGNTADAATDTVPDQAQESYVGALHLAQALVQLAQPPRLWLVTCAAQAVTEREPVQITGTPIWGLARTITLEHPDLRCSTVDLPAGVDPAAVAGFAQELLAAGAELQLAYRQGQRYVARLERYRPTPNPTAPQIHAEASYLITGGLGGLGLEVARSLVAQGARSLVLSGRSGARRPEAQAAVAELEAAGAVVQVIAADVGQRADVVRLLAACDALAPLRGIFHAAGVLDDGVLFQQTAARYATVAAPKVQGGWYLHTLTQDRPLDFFILFSSIASLLGSAGQANHAAANAFLDGLAHQRAAAGLTGLSINWGGWSEIGAIMQMSQHWVEMDGMGLIAPAQGVAVFNLLARQAARQVGVMPVNWRKFQQNLPMYSLLRPAAPPPTTVAQTEIRQQLLQATATERKALLAAHISAQVSKVLRRRDAIAPDEGFFELGMDSLMALELRNTLQTSLECKLPGTLTFDYPTSQALVAYLYEQLFPQAEAEAAPAAQPETDDYLTRLDTLSEQELTSLLDQTLSSLDEPAS